jgi:hypothetical protein
VIRTYFRSDQRLLEGHPAIVGLAVRNSHGVARDGGPGAGTTASWRGTAKDSGTPVADGYMVDFDDPLDDEFPLGDGTVDQ